MPSMDDLEAEHQERRRHHDPPAAAPRKRPLDETELRDQRLKYWAEETIRQAREADAREGFKGSDELQRCYDILALLRERDTLRLAERGCVRTVPYEGPK